MTDWVYVDAEWPLRQPFVDLSDAGYRAWAASVAYAVREGTDGFVSFAAARMLTPTVSPRVFAELVKAGLWECGPDGYVIALGFEEQRRRSAKAAADRERARVRMQRLRSLPCSPEQGGEFG